MEWLADPNVWASLVTLTALEIVLGIDNLVFITILVGRLPENRRDSARRLGLALAVLSRLALLASIAWIIGLTAPVFELFDHAFSWRDIILIAGGLFLLYKGTREIHERLEGEAEHADPARAAASFGGVLAQIMVLDIVFSLDSVITAVGMANELWVMATAVIVAVLIMLAASGPLARVRRSAPDDKDAGAEFPAADRHDPGRRRHRVPCAEGVHLRRDRVLGHGRGAEPDCRAPEAPMSAPSDTPFNRRPRRAGIGTTPSDPECSRSAAHPRAAREGRFSQSVTYGKQLRYCPGGPQAAPKRTAARDRCAHSASRLHRFQISAPARPGCARRFRSSASRAMPRRSCNRCSTHCPRRPATASPEKRLCWAATGAFSIKRRRRSSCA